MSDKSKSSKKSSSLDNSLEVSVLQQQITDLTEALQRERADATNVRRRSEEERFKMASYYKAMVVRDLLAFVDNLERAIKQAPNQRPTAITPKTALKKGLWEDWLKGLEGVYKQLWQALEAIGVIRIKTVGELFDPKYHEAVQMEEGDGSGTQEIVAEEYMAGYCLGDEVLRHAMVKVRME